MTNPKFKHHIMLIGFMGVGKTTISARLSQMLNMKEAETDAMIVEQQGMPITEIFSNHGEEYFRNLETQILIDLREQEPRIVSCGGGMPLRPENAAHMKKTGKVVLLTAAPETIYERVKDSTSRPLLNNNMNVDFIADLMEKRKEKYHSAADIIVSTDNKEVQEICDEIIAKLGEVEG